MPLLLKLIVLIQAAIVSSPVLTAGSQLLPVATSEFPPFEYSINGSVVGTDTEVVARVFEQIGYQADIKMLPWRRVMQMATKGEFAAIYSFTVNEERKQDYYFSKPINTVRDVFFKRKDRDIQWQELADLYPLKVGASTGYSYHSLFAEALRSNAFAGKMMVTSETPERQGLYLLRYNRVDIFICEVSVCQFLLNREQPELNMIDYVDNTIGNSRTFHVGFPKRWPNAEPIAKAFNKQLSLFIETPEFRQIFLRYGLTPPNPALLR